MDFRLRVLMTTSGTYRLAVAFELLFKNAKDAQKMTARL
jgi:hypothetical protein